VQEKSSKIAIIAGITIAVIIGGLALFVHFKLSEIEKNEMGQESAEQIAKEALEVISGNESHSELGETSEEKTESHTEEDKSAEQRANELP
jgi:flagellar basal body-associated protein FliL